MVHRPRGPLNPREAATSASSPRPSTRGAVSWPEAAGPRAQATPILWLSRPDP